MRPAKSPTSRRLTIVLIAIGPLGRLVLAQAPIKLTLGQAEALAIRNHPRIAAAGLIAQAARSAVSESRAPLYPQFTGNFTGVGAEHSSTLAAGNVQTSSLYSRVAAGVTLSQLITDFGRTKNLVESAKSQAAAQDQNVGNTRAEILMGVDQTYYQALAAGAVLKVAQAVTENRRLTLRQVQALAQSSLKSTLDVSFAEVAVSEAELALVHAENDVRAGSARLGAALGTAPTQTYELVDEPLPPPLGPDPEPLLAQALKQRPDLATLELNRDAAHSLARAEQALSRPTIQPAGRGGRAPGDRSAAEFNL